MENIPFLGTAIVSITLALVFYSIGIWAEKIQKVLKKWHIAFFLLGLVADTLGTGIMSELSTDAGGMSVMHMVTGLLALILMAVHAVWAIWTYWKGTEQAKQNFHKFSVVVWCFWLMPYLIGVYLGGVH